MKAKDIDLPKLLSNSSGYLWNTQQDLESITSKLVDARELFRIAELDYELKYSEQVELIINSGQPITTAREIAKNKCRNEMTDKSKTREVKRKLTIYYETIRERLQTIKYIGKDSQPLR